MVTNVIVEKTVEQQVVVVTNTIVQIQPSNPQVVYVPTYNPYTVYYPPPAYVYNPMAPLVTFGAGVAVGAIIANNCDWHHGGCYHGDVNINVETYNVNVNRNANVNNARSTAAQRGAHVSDGGQTKWQPDQSRLSKSGSPSAANSARSAEARGWGSGGAGPSTGSVGARPSTGTAGARPSTGTAGARPSTGIAAHASRPTAVSQREPAKSIAQRFATQGRVLLPAVLPRRAARSAARAAVPARVITAAVAPPAAAAAASVADVRWWRWRRRWTRRWAPMNSLENSNSLFSLI